MANTSNNEPPDPGTGRRRWAGLLTAVEAAVTVAVVALVVVRFRTLWGAYHEHVLRRLDYALLGFFVADVAARAVLAEGKLAWLRGRWFDLLVLVPCLEVLVGGWTAPWFLVRQVAVLVAAFAGTRPAQRLVSQLRLHPARLMVLSFALTIAVGTVLLSLPLSSAMGEPVAGVDALFTATSATCVTGLIVLDTGEDFTLFGQVVILVLLQLGGLGIMTFSVSLLLAVGGTISKQREVVMRDMLDQESIQDVLHLVRFILAITFVVEAVGAVVLFFSLAPSRGYSARTLYEAVFHAISAFCNAGFSVYNDSLEAFARNPAVNAVMSVLIIVGGLGFPVLRDLLMMARSRRLRAGLAPRLKSQTKVVLTASAVLLVAGTAIFYVADAGGSLRGMSTGERLLASWFQSVTARTAGFNTVPIGTVGQGGLLLLMALMFIGASPGSTGGGVKTTTAAVLWQAMVSAFRGREEVELFERTVPRAIVRRTVALVVLSMLVIVLATIALMTWGEAPAAAGNAEGLKPAGFEDYLFEAFSAFGTVGLSTGATRQLTRAGKLLVTVLMFVGRLGPLTLALSLLGEPKRAAYAYPEERLMVG
ncbi:MAG: TrkH family potassium uptake protein [bacterium]